MEEDDIPTFAARIKAKYPDYASVDDYELVEKVVRKHPVYASQVKLPQGFGLLYTSSGYNKIDSIYEEMGRKYNVDPNLLLEQGRQETSFNPDVFYGKRASSAGAVGAGQFMPGTAPKYGVTDRTDPIQSIEGQAKYMRKLLDDFDNDESLALAGYNAGEYRKALTKDRRVPNIPETQHYVKTIKEKLDEARSKSKRLRDFIQQSPSVQAPTPTTQPTTQPTPEAPSAFEAQLTVARDPKNMARSGVFFPNDGTNAALKYANGLDSNWALFPDKKHNGTHLINLAKAKKLKLRTPKEIQEFIDKNPNAFKTLGIAENVGNNTQGTAVVAKDADGNEFDAQIKELEGIGEAAKQGVKYAPTTAIPPTVHYTKRDTSKPGDYWNFETTGKAGNLDYLGMVGGKHVAKNPDGDTFEFDETAKTFKPTTPLMSKLTFQGGKQLIKKKDDIYVDENNDEYRVTATPDEKGDFSYTSKPVNPFTKVVQLEDGTTLTRDAKIKDGFRYRDDEGELYSYTTKGIKQINPPNWVNGKLDPNTVQLPEDRKALYEDFRKNHNLRDSGELRKDWLRRDRLVATGKQEEPYSQQELDRLDKIKNGAKVAQTQKAKLQDRAIARPAVTATQLVNAGGIPNVVPNQNLRSATLKTDNGSSIKRVTDDPTFGVAPPEGFERYADDNGQTYLVDTNTGKLQDESLAEIADRFAVKKVPLNMKQSVPVEEAKKRLAMQVADQIGVKYDLDKNDVYNWILKKGVVDVGTDSQASENNLYQTKEDVQTAYRQSQTPSVGTDAQPNSDGLDSTYSLTGRQLQSLLSEVPAQTSAKEQAALQRIAQGAISPDPTKAELEGLGVNLDRLKRNPKFYAAAEKGKQAQLNIERIADDLKQSGDFDDYTAPIKARANLGIIGQGVAQAEIDAYKKTLADKTSANRFFLDETPQGVSGVNGRSVAMAGGMIPESQSQRQSRMNAWIQRQLKDDLEKNGSFVKYQENLAKAEAEEQERQKRIANDPVWQKVLKGTQGYLLGVPKSVIKGGASVLQGAPIWTKPIANYIDSLFGTKSGSINENAIFKLGQAIKDAADTALPTDKDYDKSFLAGTVPQALGSSLAFLPAALGGPLGIALFSTLQMTGDSYEDALQGKAKEPDAQQYARLNGGLLGWTELLGFGNAFQRLVKGSAKTTWKKLALEALKEAGEEVFTNEGPQSIGSNVLAKLTYDPNRKWDKDLMDSLQAAGVTAPLASVLISGLLHVKHAKAIKRIAQNDLINGGPSVRDFGDETGFYVFGKSVPETDDLKPLFDKHREIQAKIAEELDAYQKVQKRWADLPKTVTLNGTQVASANRQAKYLGYAQEIQQNILALAKEQSDVSKQIVEQSGVPSPTLLDQKNESEDAQSVITSEDLATEAPKVEPTEAPVETPVEAPVETKVAQTDTSIKDNDQIKAQERELLKAELNNEKLIPDTIAAIKKEIQSLRDENGEIADIKTFRQLNDLLSNLESLVTVDPFGRPLKEIKRVPKSARTIVNKQREYRRGENDKDLSNTIDKILEVAGRSTEAPKTKENIEVSSQPATKPVTDEVVETATEEVVEPPKKDKFSNKPLEEVKAEGEVKYDGVDDFFVDEEKPAEKVKVNEFKVEPFKGDVAESQETVNEKAKSTNADTITIYRGQQKGQESRFADWWSSDEQIANDFASTTRGKKPSDGEVVSQDIPVANVRKTDLDATGYETIPTVAKALGVTDAELRTALKQGTPTEQILSEGDGDVRVHALIESVPVQKLLQAKGIKAVELKELNSKKERVNTYMVLPDKSTQPVDAPSDSVEVGKGEVADVDSATSKTNLDLILDRVTNENEVTLSIKDGISRDQIRKVEDAAKARGMTAAFDGHGFLIRKNIEATPKQDVGKSDAPAQLSTKEQAKALRDLGYTLPVQRTLSDVQKADIIAKSIKKQDYVADKTSVADTPKPDVSDITPSGEVADGIEQAKDWGVYKKTFADGSTWYGFKDPNGASDGAGNQLTSTKESAQQLADVAKANAEYQAKQESANADKKAADEKAQQERSNLNGFADNLTPMRRGKIQQVLDKKWNFPKVGVKTAKQFIEQSVANGSIELSTEEVNRIKEMSRMAEFRATNEQQRAHEKRVKEGGKVTQYLVNGLNLGKTAYDYAKFLLNETDFVESRQSAENKGQTHQDYVAEKTSVAATPSNRDADVKAAEKKANATVRATKAIAVPAKGTTVYSKGGVEGEVLKVDGDKVVVQWTNKDGEMAGDPVSVDVNKVFTEAPSTSPKTKSETQTDLPVTGETQTKGAVKVGDTVENIIGGWKGTIAKNADGDLVVKRGKEVWGDYSPANYVPARSISELDANRPSFEAARTIPTKSLVERTNFNKQARIADDGIIALDTIEAMELVRRVIGTDTQFYGLMTEPQHVQKALDTLDKMIERSSNPSLSKLRNLIKRASKGDGTVIFAMSEESVPEEKAHRALYNLRTDERTHQIAPNVQKSIAQADVFKNAKQFHKDYARRSVAEKVEEFAVKASLGQWNDLGITDEQSKREAIGLAIDFYESFAEQNKGKLTKDEIANKLATEIAYAQEYKDSQDRNNKEETETADQDSPVESAERKEDRPDDEKRQQGTDKTGITLPKLQSRTPGESGVKFDAQKAEEAKAQGQKVAALSKQLGEEQYYTPQSEDETDVKAQQLISKMGVASAIDQALYGEPSAEASRVLDWELERLSALAEAHKELGNDAEAAATMEYYADLIAGAAMRRIQTGREVQSYRRLGALTPVSAQLVAQKMKKLAFGDDAKLTPTQVREVEDLARSLQEATTQLEKSKIIIAEQQRIIDNANESDTKTPLNRQEALLNNYKKKEKIILAELEKRFPSSPMFKGNSPMAMAVKGNEVVLDAKTEGLLKDYSVGQILTNKSYESVIQEIQDISGVSLEQAKDIHAMAADEVRGASEPVSAEAKKRIQIRKEHYIEADKHAHPEKAAKKAVQLVEGNLKRQIETLQKEIDTKQKDVKTAHKVTSPEIEKLKRQRDELKAERDALLGTKLTDQEKIERAIKATRKSIERTTEKIKAGDISVAKRESVTSDALKALRDEQKTLRSILGDMRREAKKTQTRASGLSKIAQQAVEFYPEDYELIAVINYLTQQKPKSINEALNYLQKTFGFQITEAKEIAIKAQQAIDRIKASNKVAAEKAKGIKDSEQAKLDAATRKATQESLKLNRFLKNFGQNPNAIKRFNNDFRAKLISNYGTQLFNFIQSFTVSTPATAMLDMIEAGYRALGVNIGEATDVQALDAFRTYLFLSGTNRQLAIDALSMFPEQYYTVHAGLMGDIELELQPLAGEKTNPIAKGVHWWFDKNDKLNRWLAHKTGAKYQEMLFRNAVVASTFDNIIRKRTGGSLESAMKDGTFKDIITENDATRAAQRALEVTFASQIDDPFGKWLKRGYDKLDNYVPVLFNPVTYARFTYTATKVMVLNPLTFGGYDQAIHKLADKKNKTQNRPEYNTREIAKGTLAWSGVAVAYGLMSWLGGDDDKWYTIYPLGKDGPIWDVRRTFPLSSFFYVAHLIRSAKDGAPPPTVSDLAAGLASLELDYFQYGPAANLYSEIGNAYSKQDVSKLPQAAATLGASYFSGLLRFFKPAKDILAQAWDKEAAVREYGDNTSDKVIEQLSKSIPGVNALYNAPVKKDIRGNDVLMPFPLGRSFGINLVHPSFVSPEDSPATQWANKLWKFQGGGDMTAEERKAYNARKAIQNAWRTGNKVKVEEALKNMDATLTPKSKSRLIDELEYSELGAKVKYNFGDNAKDVAALKTVWARATDQEKAEIAKIIEGKNGISKATRDLFKWETKK